MSRSDEIPRLEEALAAAGPEPTRERVDALNALALKVGYSDLDRTAALGREAVVIAREIRYPSGIAWGLVHDGYNEFASADYDAALSKANEACEIFASLGETEGIAHAKLGLGFIHWSLGDYELAVLHLHEATQILQEIGEHERQAWGLTSLGGVYEAVGDLDKSLECQARALELFRSVDHASGIGRALTGIAAIHKRKGNLDDALEFSQRSLELAEHEVGESRALNDIGTIYRAKGEHEKAREYLERALTMRREIEDRSAQITSLLDLGSLFIATGAIKDAIDHLKLALEIAEATKTRPKIYRAHEGLAEAYEAEGDFERALTHQRHFQRIKEEVVGEESATRLKNLQIKLEAESLEQLKQAQARLIQSEKMAALGKLVAGLAHEINTPVGVIISNTDVVNRGLSRIAARYDEDHELRKSLDAIQETQTVSEEAGRRLGTIVESLRSFTRLDEADFQLADVREGIESTLSLLEPQWGDRIRVVRQLEEVPHIEGYPTELNQALMTILVNAGEAIASEGTVTVSTSSVDQHVRIRASDTGRGMPQDQLSRLFDIGFSRSGTRVRLNVGLANVQAVINKHRGEIHVESEVGRGTTFDIRLPVRQVPA